MTDDVAADPRLRALDDATCSNGAPSARNLLVTVFGDALLPHGAATSVSVRSLAALLGSFGINERLVRTSLSRLVRDGLLAVDPVARRSFYRVADSALSLFERADARIYRSVSPAWDGSWTLVVVDGAESTAARRARLRQELAWAGLGAVAPNVMASPVVEAATAAAVVDRVGGFSNVLVSRSRVVEGAATLGAEELARRCAPLDDTDERYREHIARFEPYVAIAATLGPEMAWKLRTLLVASFRRIVLAEPSLPVVLRPVGWVGDDARALTAEIYARCAEVAEEFVLATVETRRGVLASRAGVSDRFADTDT
jgi:phenylacetic acid degradation operon negative regulatory protein